MTYHMPERKCMGKGNYRRTILELVLVTAIFSLVSVFILKIYMTADRLQGQAVAISAATIRAESIAEYAGAKGVDAAARYFDMHDRDGVFVIYYDKQWNRLEDNLGENAKKAKTGYMLILRGDEPDNNRAVPVEQAVVYAGRCSEAESLLSGNMAEEDLLCKLQTLVLAQQ